MQYNFYTEQIALDRNNDVVVYTKDGWNAMRSKNSKLMEKIRKYAEGYTRDNRRSPSTTDIALEFHISRSTAYRYLVEMDEIGMIRYENGEIITASTEKISKDLSSVPIVGSIPCGAPEEEEENVERYVSLPADLFGDGEQFILRASGDSMVDAGIEDGDLVFIERTENAEPGQIVAALCDNQSTLKRLKYDADSGRMVLHPENGRKQYKDIVSPHIAVQGVARYVLKPL